MLDIRIHYLFYDNDSCDVMAQVFSGMIRKATEEKVLMEWIQ